MSGDQETARPIRLSRSSVGQEEQAAASRVIGGGFLGMGPEVKAFEDEIRSWLGTDLEVVCVNTGTAALHLAVACLDLERDDEVLVPSITYVASFQAISGAGATPVACDVRESDVFLDLEDAERRLTERTRAIMPVHYASNSSGMDSLCEFASKHDLRVIEDAAHSFGCLRNGRKVGTHGDVICFSFDGIKNITSGEGGAVVTSDSALAARVRDGRLLGVMNDTEKRFEGRRSWTFDVRHQGYRYHMSDVMAAIGREQLKKIGRFGEVRKRLVSRYRAELTGVSGIMLLEAGDDGTISHIFPIRVMGGRRDALRAALREEGIESGIHYPPNHLLGLYKTGYGLPVAEQLGEELLTLPLHAELSGAEQSLVLECVISFLTEQADG